MAKLKLKNKLRKEVLRYLRNIGYSTKKRSLARSREIPKEMIRKFHLRQRQQKLLKEKKFISSFRIKMMDYLASGTDIVPEKIDPYLVEVRAGTKESDLFRFATLNWSVPVSYGYGRRIRCLVMDKSNGKLIGIFALGDPVYNLKVRDEWIGWTQKTKAKNLVNVMDAYVLGALPPYSNLIGGKLVAALITSSEVQRIFDRKYGRSRSIIRNRRLKPKLVLITTSSALGKSSIYDRLKLNGKLVFKKIGESIGYGHFHISDEIFSKLRDFLHQIKHPYADGYNYGNGSNWKFRVIRKALSEIGVNQEFLSHGIRREVYAVPLSRYAKGYLLGTRKNVRINAKTTKKISAICKQRWIIPRSMRDKTYLGIRKDETIKRMVVL